MENNRNKTFNRREFFKSNIAGLLQSETKGLNLVTGRLNMLNKVPISNSKEHLEKRQILEKCLALFRSQRFKDEVKRKKAEKGILEQEDITPETRRVNLQKIAELAEELTDRLSEIVLGDLKRKYNMSDKCSTGFLKSGVPVTLKAVPNGLSITSEDSFDNIITIQHIGTLEYDTPSLNNYIFQYRVTKRTPQGDMKTYDVFSYLDLNAFNQDENYRKVVIENLLSDNNIEFSNANGYIGEISDTTDSPKQLDVGEQIDDVSYYRYQISPKYAIEYDGERIEAIRRYLQQEKAKEQKKDDDGR